MILAFSKRVCGLIGFTIGYHLQTMSVRLRREPLFDKPFGFD
jgi:hypothetical protein